MFSLQPAVHTSYHCNWNKGRIESSHKCCCLLEYIGRSAFESVSPTLEKRVKISMKLAALQIWLTTFVSLYDVEQFLEKNQMLTWLFNNVINENCNIFRTRNSILCHLTSINIKNVMCIMPKWEKRKKKEKKESSMSVSSLLNESNRVQVDSCYNLLHVK